MNELLNNAPCGFLVFTDDGKIVEANATLGALLGYERGELRDIHVEKIFSVAGRIFYQTHIFPLLKMQKKIEEIYLDLRSKTGENIPVLINAVRHERDSQIFNDCIFVPIRQRNQYEDEILKAKKQAEAATLAKDDFLSVVSHELRTPLNSILGWARILDPENSTAETLKKGLDTIRRNAQMQTQLIEDILDFSRIISGKLRLEVAQINLSETVEAAIDVITPAAAAKNIRITSVLDTKCVVSGDADRLQQVMWNLLTNAVKFTPKGGRVRITMQRINSSVEICVSDNGQGISADFLPYIFERFQQQDKTKSRRTSGLGLGLAITYRIVELHGGTIRVESPGEDLGATFTLSLPVTVFQQKEIGGEDINTEAVLTDGERFLPHNPARLSGFNIMIVDDASDARELIGFILIEHGANVIAVSTVSEAVEKLASFVPDLIISDIEMPGEDGFSLIKKLNDFNSQQKHKIPAIALTAHARPSERLKVLSAGYQMHLAKPVEPEELLTVVTNLTEWNKDKQF